ncbi:hypothetical protein MLD38_010846 [Melastoma candidum]|uniref:Uncharacterized protein n=1 Tax=Melastoma candidum TaxID=119954 RepID=A0ACB9R0T3_9MYRT|nr:hypothetical protein MLD38_010846 [Melastoma candidum]
MSLTVASPPSFLLPSLRSPSLRLPPVSVLRRRHPHHSMRVCFCSSGSGASLREGTGKLLDEDLLNEVASVKDADEALRIISSSRLGGGSEVLGVSECCDVIRAALLRGNVELALSVFYGMRSAFVRDLGVMEDGGGSPIVRWRWSQPDARVYTLLIPGLASVLRISDALSVLNYMCQMGVSSTEEVPFGKVVNCPTCMIAVTVAQPQDGSQIASCAKCRYKYEFISGDIITIESEEIGMDIPAWRRGLSLLNLMNQRIPAAVHSIVVQTPSGVARTHRFATETVALPAQAGERVTMALAAPLDIYRQVGPFRFSPKAPNFYPGQPISLTNHKDGRETVLLKAPEKDSFSFLNPSVLLPLVAVLATGDAASGLLDPSLPQLLSVGAISSIAAGTTLNLFILPQLNRLPQKSVDAIAVKQQLLSQYSMLQSRIKGLREAAEKEVWMLGRMCQLENKINVVGEPSYRARKDKVKRVREGLEISLKGRIELIESYARISSMIEIEVEMDSNVLAAEAVGNAENVAQQIQQLMEIENLEERWKLQAEANDEAERLLSTQPMPVEEDLGKY